MYNGGTRWGSKKSQNENRTKTNEKIVSVYENPSLLSINLMFEILCARSYPFLSSGVYLKVHKRKKYSIPFLLAE